LPQIGNTKVGFALSRLFFPNSFSP